MKVTTKNGIEVDLTKRLSWVFMAQLMCIGLALRVLISPRSAVNSITQFLNWCSGVVSDIQTWWHSSALPGQPTRGQRFTARTTAAWLAARQWVINVLWAIGIFYAFFFVSLLLYAFAGPFPTWARAAVALFILLGAIMPYVVVMILNRHFLRWLLYPFAITVSYLIVMGMAVVSMPASFGVLPRLALVFGLLIWPIGFSLIGRPAGKAAGVVAIGLVMVMAFYMAIPQAAKDTSGNVYDTTSGVISRDCYMYKISDSKVVRQNLSQGTPVYFRNGNAKNDVSRVANFLDVKAKSLRPISLEDGTKGVVHKTNVRAGAIGRKTSYRDTSPTGGSGGGNTGPGSSQIIREVISFSTGTWSGSVTSGKPTDPVQPLSGFGLPSSKTYVAVSPVGVTLQWYCADGRGGWEYLGSYQTNSSEKPYIYADRTEQVGRLVGVVPFFGQ